MGNENKKDFNFMMNNNKDMPKIQVIKDEKTIKKYSGTKMFFAPPLYYDKLMKKVPKGKLITVSQMRDYLAKQNNADFTDPMTAGILYKSIEQHINNKDISKKMQCRVRDLTMAYAKEWEQTVSDYYKLGVVDGFKNRNKLNDILGGKSYEQ